MSEEILRALMQLFGIIAKQDDGLTEAKRQYVELFLKQQIKADLVGEYLAQFDQFVSEKKKRRVDESVEEAEDNRTSMTDSVRTLGICKKINKTLDQKQKVIVFVRLLELVNSDRNFSDSRMAIINTTAEVFKIEKNEYESISSFVRSERKQDANDPNVLIVADNDSMSGNCRFLASEHLDGFALILLVPSVNLYFVRYSGHHEMMLNGLVMDQRRVYLLASGATMRPALGRTIYYSDVSSIFLSAKNDTKISFNARNLSYTFKGGNVGLRDVSISESQGKLIGIMGASGAGKTTLLNVLAGLEQPTSGELLINGINLHQYPRQLEGVIGYVPQDDLLIEELTVYENLYYNARLCFKDLTDFAINKLVLEVLENLGLTKAKELKVGSALDKTISGGQRKRLNIALELIREPSILFLDEPTSGLSSKDSENIIDLLRQIALKGKLVFVVIHQPSSEIYKSFDKIVFLDTGGYQIYYGNPVEAVVYFKTQDQQVNSEVGECPSCGNVNPELVFNIVEARVVDEYGNLMNERKVLPEQWNSLYQEHVKFSEVQDLKESKLIPLKVPGKLSQFLVFWLRDFRAKLSNKQYMLISLLGTPVLALFLSFIIRYISDPKAGQYIFRENDNIPAYLLMCIIVSLFVGLTVSAEEIFKDRKILKRESFLHLSRFSYLSSKVSILFLLSAIQSLMLALIGNVILGIKGMYMEYWMMLFAVSCFANLLGLNISNTFNSAVTIYIVIPLLIIPQMVLAGAMFSFDKLNHLIGGGHKVPVIAQVMASRWAYEGLVVEQYAGNDFEKRWFSYDRKASAFDYQIAYRIPELEAVLKESLSLLDSTSARNKEKLAANLALLKNEFSKEIDYGSKIKFEALSGFSVKDYNQKVYDQAMSYLDKLNTYYGDLYNLVSQQKEQKVNGMMQLPGFDFSKFRSEYENDNLKDIVENKLADHKIVREGDRLVQVVDPIYMGSDVPVLFSIDYPFYSPFRYLMNIRVSTYIYNLLVVWGMTLVLFVSLYYSWLNSFARLFTVIAAKRKKNILA